AGMLLRGDRPALFAKGDGPHARRSRLRSVPADDLAGIALEQKLEGRGGETPVVVGIVVDAEVKRARQQQDAIGPQHAVDLVEPAPEAAHMLEGVEADHRADRAGLLRQILDLRDAIDARPRTHVDADIRATWKEAAEIEVVLAFDLVGAD